MSDKIAIADIEINDRVRRDLGDLAPLRNSIEAVGLIQPIVLGPGNKLLCGARRTEACRQLGWTHISYVRSVDRDDAISLLIAERDENTCRKEMTASELAALGRRLEALERPRAQARQLSGLRQGGHAPLGPMGPNGSRTDKLVGKALGVSQSHYKRVKTIIAATQHENPAVAEVASEQLAKVDAGQQSVHAADRIVREKKSAVDFSDPLIDADAEPEVIPGLPKKSKSGKRPNHRAILTNATNALGGVVMALDGISELNCSVNTEEARRFLSDLSTQIRSLNRIRNLLKERVSNE